MVTMLHRSLPACRKLLLVLQEASNRPISTICQRHRHQQPSINLRQCRDNQRWNRACTASKQHISLLQRCVHSTSCPLRCSDSGHGVNWDNFGIWNERIEEPILLDQSIKHGIPIPKISVQRIGQDSLTGRRSVNEDRIFIKELRPDLLCAAIFDGHAGAMTVDFVHHHLQFHIKFWLEREHDLQVVMRNAFEDLNNKLTIFLSSNYPETEYEHTGSTATVALVRNGNELVLANLGDSRAILCRDGQARRLTNDHEPEYNSSEKDRIKANGGFITWNSLGKPLVNGILTMTRSFGDLTLKQYGVTATPETRSLEIKHGRDSFLVLCTDGVHFVMNDQELCDSVGLCHNPQEAASFLCDQALQFGSEDNASVVVVPLAQWGRKGGPSLVHSLRWQGRSGA